MTKWLKGMEACKTLTTRERLAHLAALWCSAYTRSGRGCTRAVCYSALRDMLFPPEGERPLIPAEAARRYHVSRMATTRWRRRFLADVESASALCGLGAARVRADLGR